MSGSIRCRLLALALLVAVVVPTTARSQVVVLRGNPTATGPAATDAALLGQYLRTRFEALGFTTLDSVPTSQQLRDNYDGGWWELTYNVFELENDRFDVSVVREMTVVKDGEVQYRTRPEFIYQTHQASDLQEEARDIAEYVFEEKESLLQWADSAQSVRSPN